MISMTMELAGEAVVARRLFLLREETEAKVEKSLMSTGRKAADFISGLAPVDTGEYEGTIDVSGLEGAPGERFVRVGTGAAQARRLEFDFRGPDVRGRTYNHVSLPHRHFTPALGLIPGWLAEGLR